MSAYQIQVHLNKLTCRDTESLHSSDKFALAGAITTGTDTAGFVLPTFRINDSHPDNVRQFENLLVFDGGSETPDVGIVFQAWDMDENDGWVENRDEIVAVSLAIAAGVKLVPGGVEAGAGMELAVAAIVPVIDQFVQWDKDDELLRYGKWWSATAAGPFQRSARDVSIQFGGDDGVGYSTWDYTLDLTIVCTATPTFKATPLPHDLAPRQLFQYAAADANNRRFEGGYPVFHSVSVGLTNYSTQVFLRAFEDMEGRVKSRRGAATERVSQKSVVLHSDLGGPPLDDFRATLRATSQYCQNHGGVGGFPTFENADIMFRTICGVMTLYPAGADWRAVRLTDLGNPAPDDIPGRFVAVHNYAIRNGYLGGFPDYNDTEWGNGVVQCGVVLIHDRAGKVYNPLYG